VYLHPQLSLIFQSHGKPPFRVDAYAAIGLLSFLEKILSGYYGKPNTLCNRYRSSSKIEQTYIRAFALWNSRYTGCAGAYKDNCVSCGLDFIVKALSQTFRDAAYNARGSYAKGDTFAPSIRVNATWC
jgi:hypothetical protein